MQYGSVADVDRLNELENQRVRQLGSPGLDKAEDLNQIRSEETWIEKMARIDRNMG